MHAPTLCECCKLSKWEPNLLPTPRRDPLPSDSQSLILLLHSLQSQCCTASREMCSSCISGRQDACQTRTQTLRSAFLEERVWGKPHHIRTYSVNSSLEKQHPYLLYKLIQPLPHFSDPAEENF